MSPDDPRHGNLAGYVAGCRESCCRTAAADYERARQKRRDYLGERRLVPALGTTRRLRALGAIGWPGRAIADAAGLHGHTIWALTRRPTVNAKTAAAVARAYDLLSMTPGPSDVTRKRAARSGWLPPLAWDDDAMDDPDAQPAGSWRPVRNWPAAELLAEWTHLRGLGVSAHHAARQLGVTVEAVEKAIERGRVA